ncbi:C-X-C motif chemokine 3-like [Callorhinchus milii]|uniref:C-X-C motif chemokine 3-like n=1 Tax=Callorhinchus milii TaxID=7868 RepID=A0A4W3HU49_CALMI|nr:C-X-C motif chemokine 3-like [Callorhinchus milii]|eukprot:gi/632937063/ref/XP_007897203.1/ PREDICTED: C-X-C motif chemokine 3-like [Callorhinchus milii]
MNCKLQIATLLALILVCAHFPEASAVPRCLCLNFIERVPKKFVKDFLIIPKSSHCTKTQIILTISKGSRVMEACLNSELDQGMELITCWNRINHDIGRKEECIRPRRTRTPK